MFNKTPHLFAQQERQKRLTFRLGGRCGKRRSSRERNWFAKLSKEPGRSNKRQPSSQKQGKKGVSTLSTENHYLGKERRKGLGNVAGGLELARTCLYSPKTHKDRGGSLHSSKRSGLRERQRRTKAARKRLYPRGGGGKEVGKKGGERETEKTP